MGRLDDKVAFLVGGSSGFGLATAERFAAEGATVVIAGRRADLAEEVAERLGGAAFGCDVTDFHRLHEVTEEVVERFGRIDVGINFAGYAHFSPIKQLTPEVVEPMVAVQFTAALYFIQAMGNAMAGTGGGSIISISSLTAQNPAVGHAPYAGSKKGIEFVSQCAAVEYGPDGVRVNCIAAHLIETPMTAAIFEQRLPVEAMREQTPLGRMGHVDDIANAALFLASDEAAYISGETIRVDGGAFTQKLPSALDYERLAATRPDLLE